MQAGYLNINSMLFWNFHKGGIIWMYGCRALSSQGNWEKPLHAINWIWITWYCCRIIFWIPDIVTEVFSYAYHPVYFFIHRSSFLVGGIFQWAFPPLWQCFIVLKSNIWSFGYFLGHPPFFGSAFLFLGYSRSDFFEPLTSLDNSELWVICQEALLLYGFTVDCSF